MQRKENIHRETKWKSCLIFFLGRHRGNFSACFKIESVHSYLRIHVCDFACKKGERNLTECMWVPSDYLSDHCGCLCSWRLPMCVWCATWVKASVCRSECCKCKDWPASAVMQCVGYCEPVIYCSCWRFPIPVFCPRQDACLWNSSVFWCKGLTIQLRTTL